MTSEKDSRLDRVLGTAEKEKGKRLKVQTDPCRDDPVAELDHGISAETASAVSVGDKQQTGAEASLGAGLGGHGFSLFPGPPSVLQMAVKDLTVMDLTQVALIPDWSAWGEKLAATGMGEADAEAETKVETESSGSVAVQQRMMMDVDTQQEEILLKEQIKLHPPLQSKIPIYLEPVEIIILQILKDYNNHYSKANITMRVAGGWVRDKLMQPQRQEEQQQQQQQQQNQQQISRQDQKKQEQEQEQKQGQERASQDYPVSQVQHCHHNHRTRHHHLNSNHYQTSKVDLDITVDNISGYEFSKGLVEFVTNRKHQYENALPKLLQANPDQSAHLETARVFLYGVPLDIVNLRSEVYSGNSRIPSIQVGSPLQDALRRDLTINSLFYNINENRIEDFCGRGIYDLYAKYIRTPLEARKTLLDDPLRALRAIRFTSRLNFNMDKDLVRVCKTNEIHVALENKVSKERITTELDAMISSSCPRTPIQAFGLLVEMNLYDGVLGQLPEEISWSSLSLSSSSSSMSLTQSSDEMSYRSLGCLINLHSLFIHHFDGQNEHTQQDIRIARLAALFAPYAGATYIDPQKRRETPLIHYLMSKQLSFRVKDMESVNLVHQGSLKFQQYIQDFDSILDGHGETPGSFPTTSLKTDRLRYGRLLRETGPLWRVALQISLIRQLSCAKAAHTYTETLDVIPDVFSEPDQRKLIERFEKLQKYVDALELDEVWLMKPLITGKELMKDVLHKLPKGPMVGHMMEKMIDWQLENPKGRVDTCIEWFRTEYPDYV